MRVITTHQINPANEALNILVLDEPGAGGACHNYDITGFPSDPLKIRFQNGPIKEAGVNGITQEVLLAVVIDRLSAFQAGPYACRENAAALKNCEEALLSLQSRTQRRVEAGIEGTNEKDPPTRHADFATDEWTRHLALENEGGLMALPRPGLHRIEFPAETVIHVEGLPFVLEMETVVFGVKGNAQILRTPWKEVEQDGAEGAEKKKEATTATALRI